MKGGFECVRGELGDANYRASKQCGSLSTEGERRPLTCSMLGKHVQRQLEVEEQQTRTGAGGGGASYQLKFPTYFSHQLLTNFPLFSQRLCPAGMGGSSFTLPLGATFLESGFTSATPRPSSSEPNNVE